MAGAARLALDVESYPDYFLVCMVGEDAAGARHVRFFEAVGADAALPDRDRDEIGRIMNTAPRIVTYNGSSYDVPMVRDAVAQPKTAAELNEASSAIVASASAPIHRLKRDPRRHVDCMRLIPMRRSLKESAAMLGAPDISELPYDPAERLADDPAKLARIRDYCANDCENTLLVHDRMRDAVELRARLSRDYPTVGRHSGGFASALDSQIGEWLIADRCRVPPRDQRPAPPKGPAPVRYRPPSYLAFDDKHAARLLADYAAAEFSVAPTGALAMPDGLAAQAEAFEFRGQRFVFGVGGLHSAGDGGYVLRAVPGELEIRDYDVASYYPQILLRHRSEPVAGFHGVYRGLVGERLDAKRRGDVHVANALKLAVNGVFGKLKHPMSALYSPETFLDVVATGQFALLMLVEEMRADGVAVVSANTDGVTVAFDPRASDAAAAASRWERATGYALEGTDYRTFAMRDVNNYVAVLADGSVKAKGEFADQATDPLKIRPQFPVCADACRAWIARGVPPADTIGRCADLRKFLTVRRVQTGVVDERGEPHGRLVRYYRSTDPRRGLFSERAGAAPVTMPDGQCAVPVTAVGAGVPPVPAGLDRDWYVDKACDMLRDIGEARAETLRTSYVPDMFGYDALELRLPAELAFAAR